MKLRAAPSRGDAARSARVAGAWVATWVLVVLVGLALGAGCAETIRCEPGSVFGDDGRCVAIPDGGPDEDGG